MAITAIKGKTALTGNSAIAYAMKQINPGRVRRLSDNPVNADCRGVFKLRGGRGRSDRVHYLERTFRDERLHRRIGRRRARDDRYLLSGLALMWEMLYVASGMRACLSVMTNVNRALSRR